MIDGAGDAFRPSRRKGRQPRIWVFGTWIGILDRDCEVHHHGMLGSFNRSEKSVVLGEKVQMVAKFIRSK